MTPERTFAIQTLLMTDVVGSTRLWAEHPDAMPRAIERMETLAQAAVEAEGGELVKRRGEGDSLFCVFPTPAAAARAARRLVVALREESWPEGISPRVRASIHCGPAHERGGDLFGPMPNRCARLREIGHGDQILLTGAARAQIVGNEAFGLRDLGRHRLRDLDEPEAVFQIVADDLPDHFPPLRSLTSLRNNLPTQYTSFIGREALRKELADRLGRDRFTTLTGVGGAGKTRLALQLGADAIDRFSDGVWFVELAEFTDESAIVRAIADASGHRDLPDGNALDALADRLRARAQTLFIVDNAEQALGPTTHVLTRLSAAAPDLRFVVTSREPLRLRGERLHRVPPLTVPEPGCDDPTEVANTEAGALFVDRAELRMPDFILDKSNASAIAQIVRRLDGIPLCLEMAASHVDYLGPDQIAARLHDRFALLEGDDAEAPLRHRTMRETIAWQFDTLAEEDKILLQRLASFAGGFTLEDAEAVGGEVPLSPDRILRHLRALVDKSLVVATPDGGGMRYRLLETIAQFAAERPEGGTEAAMPSLFRWALALAETSYAMFYGPEHDRWRSTIESALASIHRGLDWALSAQEAGASLAALRMTRFWHMTGRYATGRDYLARAAALSTDEHRPEAWSALGVFCNCLGDWPAAEAAFRRAIDDAQADMRTRGRALSNLAIGLNDRSRFDEALEAYDGGIEALLTCGDEYGARLCRLNRALLYSDTERHREATRELQLLVEEYTVIGDRYRVARCLNAIASLHLIEGDVPSARKELVKAMKAAGTVGENDFYENAYLCAAIVASFEERWDLMAYFFGGHERIHADLESTYSPRSERAVAELKEKVGWSDAMVERYRSVGRSASSEELRPLAEALFDESDQLQRLWRQTQQSLGFLS